MSASPPSVAPTHPEDLMAAADRIWIGTTLILLGTATAAINVPILPSGALIGFGIGTLLYGVIQLRRSRRP